MKKKKENQEEKNQKESQLQSTEITISLSAVLPTGEYENLKPLYSIKEVWEGKINKEERTKELRAFLQKQLDADYQQILKRRIEKLRSDFQLEIIDGELYPSITSIINWQGIDYDPIKLQQYASRGTIVHKIISEFLKTGKWKEAEEIPELTADILIVRQGELGLDWRDCNPKGFLEKYQDKMKIIDFEKKVINEEYKYFGIYDIYGEWEGKKAIMDWKTSSNINETTAFKQMSAYAYGLNEKVECLIILPLNPSNKQGFGTPIITDEIDRYFSLFLQDRANFKKVYGI